MHINNVHLARLLYLTSQGIDGDLLALTAMPLSASFCRLSCFGWKVIDKELFRSDCF